MTILILGGSGLIGQAVARHLVEAGHEVSCLARDTAAMARRMPAARWHDADLAQMTSPDAWITLLAEADVVVNCAGALQDGPRDDVVALQERSMVALYEAAGRAGTGLIVQISARAVLTRAGGSGSDMPFLATKRAADAALALSGVPHVILKPAVVVGRNAYGGTALLRGLAGLPLITPLIHARSRMQFVALADLCAMVHDAVEGRIASGAVIELAAREARTLEQAIAAHRRWLGLRPARLVAVPGWAGSLITGAADLAGRAGWRSPMRSTAMDVAAEGIDGHVPSVGLRLHTLDMILDAAPAGVQDLWFARLYLLKPILMIVLSLFWIASGLVALLGFGAAAGLLSAAGLPPGLSASVTIATGLADILLGVAVLFRRFSSLALKAMIALSGLYLAAATVLMPALWLDPLGPLVKVLPSIALALVALAILEER